MAKRNGHTILYYTPAIGWGILICVFSLMPGKELPEMLKSAKDYVLHFSIYAVLGLLFVGAINKFSLRPIAKGSALLVFFGAMAMGIAIEIGQETLVQGRHFQWSDVFFNTLGISVLFVANALLNRCEKVQKQRVKK